MIAKRVRFSGIARGSISCIALFCAACGGGDGPAARATPTPSPVATITLTPAPTPTVTPMPVASVPTCTALVASPTSLSPYSSAAFTATLDNTRRLQFPQSSGECLSDTELRSFFIAQDNWFLDGDGRMAFTFENGVRLADASFTTRLELRGESFAGDAVGNELNATIFFSQPTGESTNFTVAQIYGESNGKPILRIERIASRNGITDHIWAIYRFGDQDGEAIYYDLGERPPVGTPFEIAVKYNSGGGIELSASTSATDFLFAQNFDFWTQLGKTTYFKAGCYVQADGHCDVRFAALEYIQ